MSRLSGLVLTALIGVSSAAAQDPGPVTPIPDIAKWDASGAWEVLGVADQDPKAEGAQWNDSSIVGWHLGVGRYWTTHLKSEFGLTLIPQSDGFDYDRIAVVSRPDMFIFTENSDHLTTFSADVAYQFFENAFTHPYVSAGVRVDSLREHRFRDPAFGFPPLDERSTSVTLRPFVGLGGKFYFNERAFLRAELPITFGTSGVYSAGFQFGFGMDF